MNNLRVESAKQLATGLGPISIGMGDGLLNRLLPDALPRLAAWTRRPAAALPPDAGGAPGYRDLAIKADGSEDWTWPWSNQAERITVWLRLAQVLRDASWTEDARRYADAMLSDPVRGIYAGPEQEYGGLVWYWRESGDYMTNYAMRVPPAFLDLFAVTGDARYEQAAIRAGRAMLRLTGPVGIPYEGWTPPGLPASRWVGHAKINSRIGYATLTYARLWKHTGEKSFSRVLDCLVSALCAVQGQDGGLPEDLLVSRNEPLNARLKCHFMSYVLNGAGPALELLPEHDELRGLAVGIGDHLLGQLRRCGGIPYGHLDTDPGAESRIWLSTHGDAAPGLLALSRATGNRHYAEAASRVLLNAMLQSFDCPDQPNLHGGMPTWHAPGREVLVGIGGYFHFFTLLGLCDWLVGHP
ncbi:MAG: hypothetical protein K9N49_01210 [Candidatus Marinimicrobia bacterium]|nr:hypothetical protein [Candidatus Neomarinimicrobiota bacterium]